MKRIIATPAGRERYLKVLLKNLIKNKQDFDEWHLWLNTTSFSDIEYCKKLEAENSWIKTFPLMVPYKGNESIYSFFKYCTDPDTVYLRLDDDIVFLEKNFCKEIFKFRINNPEPFLVYGNILNNSCISFLHQQKNLLNFSNFKVDYDCVGNLWKPESAYIVKKMHEVFIKKIKTVQSVFFLHFKEPWLLKNYERVSINCISWLGKTFASFGGHVETDEECWLACNKPRELQTPNVVFGEAVCSHFSFYTQRDYMDNTDLLEQYDSISHL
jgi:hypothetical protein